MFPELHQAVQELTSVVEQFQRSDYARALRQFNNDYFDGKRNPSTFIITNNEGSSKMTDQRYDLLLSGKACVANRTKDAELIQWAEEKGLRVYIGRENGRCREKRSIWHNPFKGEDAIQRFEEYLNNKPELLSRIDELKGKLLVCYCYPKPCHGDILARLANKL